MADVITAGKVVAVKYTMKSLDGKLLDDSGPEPEAYIHGAGAIVIGLERALEGKQAGEKVNVRVSAADGFGPRKRSAGPQPVPRSTFPEDARLKPGVKFSAETPNGAPVSLYITRVEKNAVYVDTNHPFAGMSLQYEVEVVSVRDATEREKKDGVPAA
jgi:FKBP-type peptidyl-prolyl cis-trans isomerase SlyD